MSFHSIRVNFNVILLVLLGIYNRVDFMMAHQCYVCGPKTNVSCDRFDPANKSFIKECPSAKGCITQTHENFVERACGEDIEFRDCQIANNVQYCYCSKSLCNGKNAVLIIDDEDLSDEGSGAVITNTIQKEQKTNVTSQSSQIEFYLFSIYVPVFLIVYN